MKALPTSRTPENAYTFGCPRLGDSILLAQHSDEARKKLIRRRLRCWRWRMLSVQKIGGTVSVLIILIVVLLLLFGGGVYVYRSGWWGPAPGKPNAGPVGNPLAIISVVVLIIVFVLWRLTKASLPVPVAVSFSACGDV
jgi:hypothetical protein